MMPEQQQRILGYFIEEAKDHLNTIEQGLLSLQKTIEDNEMVNEVFRAAHSIKGGAAMLGIESVQRTAHRLEDYFKVLKESPVQTDRTLESMFLQVFDGLQSLVEELQGSFGLTEDKAQEVMGDVEPVFGQLEHHLNSLVAQAESSSATPTPKATVPQGRATPSPPAHTEESALRLVFRSDVPGHLRDMLRLFKQTDNAESRNALQRSCDSLLRIGEQFDLTAWCELLRLAGQAVGNPEHTYRALAPVVIKDVKQAQEWVLGGRASEIVPSDAMQVLLPPPEIVMPTTVDGDLDDLLDSALAMPEEPDLGELFTDSSDGQPVDNDLGELFADESLSLDLSGSVTASDLDAGDLENDLFAPETDAIAMESSGLTDDLGDLFEVGETSEAIAEASLDVSADVDVDDLFPAEVHETPEGVTDLPQGGDDWWLEDGDTSGVPETINAADLSTSLGGATMIGAGTDEGLRTQPQGPEVGAAELNSLADLFEGEITDSPWQEEEDMTPPETTDEASLDIDISNEFSDLLLSDSDTEDPGNGGRTSSQEELASLFGDVSLDETEEPVDEIVTAFEIDTDAPELEDLAESFEEVSLDYEQNQDHGIAVDLNLDPGESDLNTGNLGEILGDLDLDQNQVASEPVAVDQILETVGAESTLDNDFDDLFDSPESSDSPEDSSDDHLDTTSPVSASATNALENSIGTLAAAEDHNPDHVALEADEEFDSLFDAPLNEVSVPPPEDSMTPELFLDELGVDEPASTVHPPDTDVRFDSSPEPNRPDVLALERGDDFNPDGLAALEFETAEPIEQGSTEIDVDLDMSEDSGLSVTSERGDAPELASEIDDLFAVSPAPTTSGVLAESPPTGRGSVASVEDPWDAMELEGTPVASGRDAAEAPLSLLDDPWGNEAEIAEEASEDQALEALDSLWEVADEHATTAIEEMVLPENGASDAIDSATEESFDLFNDESSHGELAADFEDLELSAERDNSINLDSDAVTTHDDSADHDIDSFIDEEANQPETELDETELDDLEAMLDEASSGQEEADNLTDAMFSEGSDFEGLDALINEGGEADAISESTEISTDLSESSEFDDLEALLDGEDEPDIPPADLPIAGHDFDELDQLLGDDVVPEPIGAEVAAPDEFGDLEKLLEQADQALGGGGSPTIRPGSTGRSNRRSAGMGDQTMRVSVKHLDTLSNLVGELVVNRNSLEQDQERLRQFLDNLLFQVQQLNDVGQRMRDLYERSLLESSLISSRQAFHSGGSSAASTSGNGENGNNHATGATFDALEMDRFTGFHTLSQEMIELIVRVRESASDIGYTVESSDQITRQFRQVTTQLQEGLNKARMVPFAQTADRLPRAVRDISLKCGKEARLVVEGRDTLIDKMILERLYDPMTHLVNNAITHGIETPEERSAAGKSREGTITVRAFYQGNQTVIYIADDGAGINSDIVKQKAIKKGLLTQAEASAMSVVETHELLFRPGFSTRDQADDFAGRGVGMDVVRTAISEIRGNITIDSEMGKGTSFTIRLPLTLSISKALSCLNNQARIAFPMDGVEDMFDVPKERIQTDDNGHSSILWRDTTLPFQSLSDLLSFNRTLGRGRVYGGSQDEDIVSIVVLRSANAHIGLQVDRVLGEQEIVIKQLEGPVPKPIGIAGATVLGDGRVMPIADVLELIDLSQGRVRRDSGAPLWSQDEGTPDKSAPAAKAEPTVLIVDDSITVRELLSMSFNKVGYRVEQARDGQEAWEKLRSGLPCDLVFCDIEMPRMDGLELLSRLQKDGTLKSMPIAMLTSRGADRHRQMAVDLGASGYFTKPYLEEALLDAAQRMLNGEVLLQSPTPSEN